MQPVARSLSRLRQDIADKAIYRDLQRHEVEVDQARKLFVYLVESSGEEFNLSRRAADLGANSKSVRKWFQLLLQTMLLHVLPRRDRKAHGKLGAHPKVYASDHGLVRALSAPWQDPRVESRVFEAVVFRHLRWYAQQHDASLQFFRHSRDTEIDFVLEAEGEQPLGIEVTSSTSLRTQKRERVTASANRAGLERMLLLHGSPQRARHQDASGRRLEERPLWEFLEQPSKVLQEARR